MGIIEVRRKIKIRGIIKFKEILFIELKFKESVRESARVNLQNRSKSAT